MVMKKLLAAKTYILPAILMIAFSLSAQAQDVPVRYVSIKKGSYANDGRSWAGAKNNLQDAIEDLKTYMAANSLTEGHVYVSAGRYTPTTATPGGDGTLYTSFIIYEGIKVYGGFDADTPESKPEDRLLENGETVGTARGERWKMKNETTLSGNHTNVIKDPLTWNEGRNEYAEAYTGNSYHVVWFASNGLDKTTNRALPLNQTTVLDGFTVRDGYAYNRSTPETAEGKKGYHAYHNSYGAGIYMVAGSEVRNCIITQNASSLRGGGVYLDGGGLLEQCHVTRNQSAGVGVTDGYGGGVAIDGPADVSGATAPGGMVRHCLIENNVSRAGAGVSLIFFKSPGEDYKLRYSSSIVGCVINNNTSTAEAGGVYLRNGGALNHVTIARNKCAGVSVAYGGRKYARSGGLHVDGGAIVMNSVLWGNEVKANNDVQFATYRDSASMKKTTLAYVALSRNSYVDWSGTIKLTNGVYSLSDDNNNTDEPGAHPEFVKITPTAGVLATDVQSDWTPRFFSYLRHKGMQVDDYPGNDNIIHTKMHQDYVGDYFAPRCAIGALVAYTMKGDYAPGLTNLEKDGKTVRTIFVDPEILNNTSMKETGEGIGGSWDRPFHNINDAIHYITNDLTDAEAPSEDSPIQIVVKEGTCTTAGNAYQQHLRASTLTIPSYVRMYGGFPADLKDKDISKRNPKETPTRITANIVGGDYKDNGTHIIVLGYGASHVVVDGFQLYYANTQPNKVLTTLGLEAGAGIAVINGEKLANGDPTGNMVDNIIRNCVVANCTAPQGAAIYMQNYPGRTMELKVENCIIHNNAVTKDGNGIVVAEGAATTLSLDHCLIRGNVGHAIVANNNAQVTVSNTAVHANIQYNGQITSNVKVAELHADDTAADSRVVTFNTDGTGSITGSNNMMDIGIKDFTGVAESVLRYHSNFTNENPNFVNPTNNIGVNEEGDVTTYGGTPDWMPTNTNPMVNAAADGGMSDTDLTCHQTRNRGGAADIGALENTYQPEYGKVIYVRDYGIDNTNEPGGDGSSWAKAINGNSLNAVYKNNHGFKGVDAELYAEGTQLTGLQWAVDRAFYLSLEKDADNNIVYRTITGVTCFKEGNESTEDNNKKSISVSDVDQTKRVEVWVKQGEYLRRDGFFMRDAVDVFGGFPKEGNPGMKERDPKKYETIIETNKSEELTPDGIKGGTEATWGTQSLDFHKDNSVMKMNSWSIVDYSSDDDEGFVKNCIDGNTDNFWHSKWQESGGHGQQNGGFPQWVIIDLGKEESIASIKVRNRKYFPRTYTIGYASTLNDVQDHKVDLDLFTTESHNNNNNTEQTINLNSTITCRYLYIGVTKSTNDKHVDIQEIQVYSRKDAKSEITHIITPASVKYDLNGNYTNAYKTKRVLTQPFPYFKGTGQINGQTVGKNLEFDNLTFNPFSVETTWDGFTIQNGRTQIKHQRDGGAGVALRENGRLANCIVRNNVLWINQNARGAGIFQNGGVIENCVIEGNVLIGEGGNIYGAGLYQRTGTVFNTSFAKNILKGSGTMQGTAVFFENGRFYNNTITENVGPYTMYSGKWFSNGRIDVYNTIICNNTITGETNQKEETEKNKQFNCTTAADKITLLNCLFDSESDHRAFDGTFTGVKKETFQYRGNTAIFDGSDPENPYRLLAGAQAINAGTEDLGLDITEKNPIELPSYDAEYTDRIKDCRVDIGAYEYNGAGSITPDISQTGYAIYYVTPYGLGDASANSPANAACWMKLQQVLDAAGRYTYDHRNDKAEDRRIAVVKLAGDSKKDRTIHKADGTTETVKEYSGFTYRPTRSCQVISPSEEENQRDYSLMVPHGVQVWGGYPEDFKEENRDVLEYRTSFSGIFRYDDVDVEAYNVVTFTNNVYDANGHLDKTRGGGTDVLVNIPERAVLDGLFLEDGKADGERAMNRAGGAAIVPEYGHIRNCIVQNNMAADKGGGLLLLPKALVSGSIIQYNSSNNKGGGLYIYDPKEDELENYEAPSEPMTWEDYAHIYTSDIIYNTANRGGGLYFTDNVRANSSLFWQNTGSEMANIAGQTAPTDVNEENHEPGIHDYPISFCATETTREPGINNIIVNTDPTKGVRFEKEAYNHDYTATDGTPVTVMHNEYEFYQLNKYSLIVRSGMQYDEYEKLLKDALMGGKDGLLRADMAGVNRADEAYDNEFIDIGARAYAGKVLPEVNDKLLMTRIFVGRNEDEVSMDAVDVMRNQTQSDYYRQEGSSFAYPMRYLGDALEYIRTIRKKTQTDGGTNYLYNNKDFEIIMCGGTYFPRRNIKGEYINGRGCTFLVPEGVIIVGGVRVQNNDNTFYGNDSEKTSDATYTYGGKSVTLDYAGLEDIIKNRRLHDINHNSIAEPWEMEEQTILSGQVVNAASSHNVFHIISCVADEDIVGGLPKPTFEYTDKVPGKTAGGGELPFERGVPIVIDGVNIEDGMALSYQANAVNSNNTYFKGGAICVEGNWTTGRQFKNPHPRYNLVGYRNIPLEVRNCTFMNNGGGRGGAIFTDGELKVFACNFAQNYARAGSDTFDETDEEGNTTSRTMTYAGRGGAINASYETTIINSIFANNEADVDVTGNKEDFEGVGGAVLTSRYAKLHVLNCDFVRNKAKGYPAIFCYNTNKGVTNDNSGNITLIRKDNPNKIVNSIFWGNESVDESMDQVINYEGFREPDYDKDIDHPEALWFCAYEAGKGNAPVYSGSNIDYRLQKYGGYILENENKYTGDPSYIPLLWNDKYNKLKDDNTTVEEVNENNPDVNEDGIVPVTNNIIINSDNDAIDGPNFISPSNVAGKDGFYISVDWMIGRINNLVDNGWTYLQQNLDGEEPTFVYEKDEKGNDVVKGAGIYRAASVAELSHESTAIAIGDDMYMSYDNAEKKPILRVSHDPNPTHHQTFIDLGVYEYQHVKLVPNENGEVDVLWVTEREKTGGAADGNSWATATSDLQRAIETLLASRNGHDKRIHMLEGNYQPVYTINGNLAFTATTNLQTGILLPNDEAKEGVRSLTIQGGYSKDLEDQFDIEQYPVHLYASERTGGDLNFNHVFVIDDMRQRISYKTGNNIQTDTMDYVVPVSVEGLNFSNVKAGNNDGGVALQYKGQYYYDGNKMKQPITNATYWHPVTGNDHKTGYINADKTGGNELYKLTLSQCSFYNNGAPTAFDAPPAVSIEESAGTALIYNSLFHSNQGKPLQAADTKVVNCTFGLNMGAVQLTGTASELHNSILWRNHLSGEDILSSEDNSYDLASTEGIKMTNNAITKHTTFTAEQEADNNVILSTNNNDALQGPNFFNPDENSNIFVPEPAPATRDFHVNPSSKILSKGSVDKYVQLVKDKTGKYPYTGSTDNAELVKMDKDLAYVTRLYGKGLERGAYECVALMNRVLYVNPHNAIAGNGVSWEHPYGRNQIQTAIDAAAVYYDVNHNPENKEEERAYVFVKGDGEPTGETLIMREGVSLYGSIDLTATAEVKKEDDDTYKDENIRAYIKYDLPDQRTGLAMGNNTIVSGVKAGTNIGFGLFDGLQIGNSDDTPIEIRTEPVVALGQGSTVALTNSIIANNRMTEGINLIENHAGLLYDLLIRDNGKADVSLGTEAYALNCTFAGDENSWTRLQAASADHSINNIIYKEGEATVPFAPYFRPSEALYHAGDVPHKDNRNLWYQLHERAPQIGTGDNGDATKTGKSLLPETLQPYVDFTADRDLLGNPRLLNGQVDLGCYETWATGAETMHATKEKSPENYAGHRYPHEGSVVYLQQGGNLVCDLKEDNSPWFTTESPLKPGYVLAQEGGSLYGQGNEIRLHYVAAERNLSGQYALVAAPFTTPNDGNHITRPVYDAANDNTLTEVAADDILSYYDGEARSQWNYEFKDDNSDCWKPLTADAIEACDGFLMERSGTGEETIRLTAYDRTNAPYQEGPGSKVVTLTQHDQSDVNKDSFHFTSEYNMGWNLKGLPYLIANYNTGKETDGREAMFVPHVVYTMNPEGNYSTAYSWNRGENTAATLSTTDAFFTQTSVIGDNKTENIYFSLPLFEGDGSGTRAESLPALTISADGYGTDRVAILPATEVEEETRSVGSLDYRFGADGVKFAALSDTLPQIAVSGTNGVGLSLLSHAPQDEEIPLTVEVKGEAAYTFSLPDKDAFASFANVYLKDHATGAVTSLMTGDYTTAISPDDSPARFSLCLGENPEWSKVRAADGTYHVNGYRVKKMQGKGVYIKVRDGQVKKILK